MEVFPPSSAYPSKRNPVKCNAVFDATVRLGSTDVSRHPAARDAVTVGNKERVAPPALSSVLTFGL